MTAGELAAARHEADAAIRPVAVVDRRLHEGFDAEDRRLWRKPEARDALALRGAAGGLRRVADRLADVAGHPAATATEVAARESAIVDLRRAADLVEQAGRAGAGVRGPLLLGDAGAHVTAAERTLAREAVLRALDATPRPLHELASRAAVPRHDVLHILTSLPAMPVRAVQGTWTGRQRPPPVMYSLDEGAFARMAEARRP